MPGSASAVAGDRRDAPLFGIVGNVIPRKGLIYLVRAMPRILAAVPEARLVVVGGEKQGDYAAASGRPPRSAASRRDPLDRPSRRRRRDPGRVGPLRAALAGGEPAAGDPRGHGRGPAGGGLRGGRHSRVRRAGETGLLVPPAQSDPLAAAIVGCSAIRPGAAASARRAAGTCTSDSRPTAKPPHRGSLRARHPRRRAAWTVAMFTPLMLRTQPSADSLPHDLAMAPDLRDRSPHPDRSPSAIGDVIHGLPLPVRCGSAFRGPCWPGSWKSGRRTVAGARGARRADRAAAGLAAAAAAVWRLRRRLREPGSTWSSTPKDSPKRPCRLVLRRKRRIGFGGRWGRELSAWLNTELVDAAAGTRSIATWAAAAAGHRAPAVRFHFPKLR